jgi:ferrous iron transport protein A
MMVCRKKRCNFFLLAVVISDIICLVYFYCFDGDQVMRLSELKVGDKAEVTALKAESVIRRRIMDMGLIKGTRFKVLRVAPLGDPIEIFFKGLYLAMRKTEADGVMVCKVSDPGDTMSLSGSQA